MEKEDFKGKDKTPSLIIINLSYFILLLLFLFMSKDTGCVILQIITI